MYQGKRVEEKPREKKRRKWPFVVGCVVLIIAGLYLTFISANIPFIANIRSMYIETAMSTLNHQWLATAFIPRSVIDEVMEDAQEKLLENRVESSTIVSPAPVASAPVQEIIEDPNAERRAMLQAFNELFPEVDLRTVPEELLAGDLERLQVKDIADRGIMTLEGDAVWALDAPNGILILAVSGDGYVGKLARVRDSSRVFLAANKKSGVGTTVTGLCQENGAVLGINASGFDDPEGMGSGGAPAGLVLSQDKIRNKPATASYFQMAGYDYDDNFLVGYGLKTSELRDGMQFYPVLVADGEKKVTGSYGMGIHPRSCIGQTTDKATLMLIIDGRQPGHSIGTTLSECADILLRYNCWTAMNMDGGSSASMTYMGEMITRTSSPAAAGRRVPDAWVVKGE